MHSPSPFRELWHLDPEITFLNHGSFGACPKPILERQNAYREQLEREPVRFFVRELEALMDEALTKLAEFLNADREELVFVPNATVGVNTVLRSLAFDPRRDELLVTNHEYNASANALRFVGERAGVPVRAVTIPFPLRSPDEVTGAILDAVTEKTRLVLVDHVTSQTGLVFPIETITRELAERGIETLVDGAHAPGMIPLDLRTLPATYYTGNCHKWMCTPKGAAFLKVPREKQDLIRPLAISHGANATRSDRSRFRMEFDWTGTMDPTAWLCIPQAIATMGSLLPGGWKALRRVNRDLVLHGRDLLCTFLGSEPPCPDEMIGHLAAVPIPDGTNAPPSTPLYTDPLQDRLFHEHGIEVPIQPFPHHPHRVLRISAQIYNHHGEYERLVSALREELPR